MNKIGISTNVEAIAWVAIGTALFSIVFASGKFAGDSALSQQIMFLRYVGGFATLIAVALAAKGSLRPYRSERVAAHFLRAMFGVSGGLALVYAPAHMPIMDSTALSLLYVIFVIPLGARILKEKVAVAHLCGLALCCGGAALIMISRGAFASFDKSYLWPAAIAIAGAALLAIEGMMIRLLAQADRPMSVLLHVNGFGLLLMAMPAILTWQPLSPWGIGGCLMLGPIAVSAQYCIVRGYRLASLSVVGPVDYSWLIFAALIGYVFFNEIPAAGVVLGSVIIAAGGVVLAATKPK